MRRNRVIRLNKAVIEPNPNIDEPLRENFSLEPLLTALYAAFAKDDREVTEAGIENYAKFLKEESLK